MGKPFRIVIPTEDELTFYAMRHDWRVDKIVSSEVRVDPMSQHILLPGKSGDLAVWFVKDWVLHRRHISQDDWTHNQDTIDYNELMRRGYGLQTKYEFIDPAFTSFLHIRFDQMYSHLIRKQYRSVPY